MKVFLIIFLASIALLAVECPEKLFSGHDIIGKGSYVGLDSSNALEMAALIASDDLAKQVSKVMQEEISKINNETFSTQITTKYTTLLKKYKVVVKEYDSKKHKANVVLKIQNSVARSLLCDSLH